MGHQFFYVRIDNVEGEVYGPINTCGLRTITNGCEGMPAECQFLIVDEAKDVSRDDFFSAYETFKQRVDTSPVQFRANTKYEKTSQDTMWFNALIFSNHADAVTIPEDDRRIAVFKNAVEKASTEYYERLHAALGDEFEPRRLYWYLKHRDVSQFNPAIPPITDAKKVMIAVSRSPAE